MKYKVLKPFKCRHQNFKVFQVDEEYKSVNKEHTEKLIKLEFVEEVKEEAKEEVKEKKMSSTKKKDDKK